MRFLWSVSHRWTPAIIPVIIATVLMTALGLVPSCSLLHQNTTDNGAVNGDRLREATFVVAASDSSSQDKQGADYVCDGIDDQVEIKTAIDALPPGGGMVALLAGTFNISAPLVILRNDAILQGMGADTELYLLDNSNCYMLIVGNNEDPFSGVCIKNIKFNGNKANQSDAVWHNIVFSGYISKSEVSECLIVDIHNSGIALLGPGTVDNLIKDNVIKNTGCHAIFLDGACDNKVIGNQTDNCAVAGIGVGMYNTGVVASGNLISGNTFNNMPNKAIEIAGGVKNTILGNTADTTSEASIQILANNGVPSTHNTIVSNILLNGGAGIHFKLATGCNDNIINENTIIPSSTGIGVYVSESGTVLRTIISNNQIETSGAGGSGIWCANALSYTLIEGNRIYAAGNHGIYIMGAPNTVIENNNITVGSNYHGIYLDPGPGTIVRGNNIEGGCEGVSVRAGSDGSVFEGNYIQHCGSGIVIRESSDIVATGNEFYHVTLPPVFLIGVCPNATVLDNKISQPKK